MSIPAHPLQWPAGWPRTDHFGRKYARFGKRRDAAHPGGWRQWGEVSIADATGRVREQLAKMGVDDIVVSTNLTLRLDGLPRSGQPEPSDPGAAVYWRDTSGATRCMAIDRYLRTADNLAAIAATLEAMRAIERHGGAEILDRAFTGFTALPGPDGNDPWWDVLEVTAHASTETVRANYQRRRRDTHPDRPGGDSAAFDRVQRAWAAFCAERGLEP